VTNVKIAFYSPLKPPDHAVPSGDRLMARLLVACLSQQGYHVELASRLRVFVKDHTNYSHADNLMQEAQSEINRLTSLWSEHGAPACWFCYHSYYKSPDLIGPELCRTFTIPYVTAEASYSERRAQGVWAHLQQLVLTSINGAAMNICFTERDKAGLRIAAPTANLATLCPFIDTSDFKQPNSFPSKPHLVAVAMMRAGDKFDSYTGLAAALKRIVHLPWTLSIVGDGDKLDEVKQLFAEFAEDRILWHGRLRRPEIAALLSRSSIYVWPGCGEAYGLAYLEAQAAGLPVIAYKTAGVPEVVDHGYSGILTPEGDDEAFALEIAKLIENEPACKRMSRQARSYVQNKHTIEQAGITLNAHLHDCAGIKT